MHNYKRSQAGVVAPPVAYESVIPNPKAKLLDQIREVIRLKHYSIRTERSYVDWTRRYVRFHKMKWALISEGQSDNRTKQGGL